MSFEVVKAVEDHKLEFEAGAAVAVKCVGDLDAPVDVTIWLIETDVADSFRYTFRTRDYCRIPIVGDSIGPIGQALIEILSICQSP